MKCPFCAPARGKTIECAIEYGKHMEVDGGGTSESMICQSRCPWPLGHGAACGEERGDGQCVAPRPAN